MGNVIISSHLILGQRSQTAAIGLFHPKHSRVMLLEARQPPEPSAGKLNECLANTGVGGLKGGVRSCWDFKDAR